MNNSHLINTLRQESQDLSQEIYILKNRLREERNLLKEITEERDSYRKGVNLSAQDLSRHDSFLRFFKTFQNVMHTGSLGYVLEEILVAADSVLVIKVT